MWLHSLARRVCQFAAALRLVKPVRNLPRQRIRVARSVGWYGVSKKVAKLRAAVVAELERPDRRELVGARAEALRLAGVDVLV